MATKPNPPAALEGENLGFAVPGQPGEESAAEPSSDTAAIDQPPVETAPKVVPAVDEAKPPVVVRNPQIAPVRLPNLEADNGDEDDNAVDTTVSIELPPTFGDAMALLKKIEATRAKTRPERRIKAGKLTKLKAHIFAMQQGSKAQPMTADDHAQIRIARRTAHTRIADRLGELAAKHPELNVAN